MNTETKKNKFLEIHKLKGANITKSCEAINISRQCYYDWMSSDSDFYNNVKEAEESTIDYVESQLMELIRNKNSGAIMFFLKCKGQNRGWIEPPKTLVQNTTENANMMIQQTINKLFVIITNHISDPKILKAISEELKDVSKNKEQSK